MSNKRKYLILSLVLLTVLIVSFPGCADTTETTQVDETPYVCPDTFEEITVLDLIIGNEVTILLGLPDICCHHVIVEWFHEGEPFDSWISSYDDVISGTIETVIMKIPFPSGAYEVKVFLGIWEEASRDFQID